MFALVLSLAAAAPAQPPAAHEAANPLYKTLLEPGLGVGPDVRVKVRPPAMADGLNAAGQRAVIEGLIGTDIPYAEFTRKSIVAPNLLRLGNAPVADKDKNKVDPVRTADVYFVAYGDFAATKDDAFLNRLAGSDKGRGSGRKLTREELKKRNIVLTEEDEKREAFGQAEFDFLEKVRLKMTGHVTWTRGPESVVAAAEVDPRFRGDKEFPNEWRAISKAGGAKVGAPQPYGGAGMYLKVTKLAEPAGALFVEQHIVFTEPVGWFDGANLLGSKLPLAVQISTRNARKEWADTLPK